MPLINLCLKSRKLELCFMTQLNDLVVIKIYIFVVVKYGEITSPLQPETKIPVGWSSEKVNSNIWLKCEQLTYLPKHTELFALITRAPEAYKLSEYKSVHTHHSTTARQQLSLLRLAIVWSWTCSGYRMDRASLWEIVLCEFRKGKHFASSLGKLLKYNSLRSWSSSLLIFY